VERAEVVVVGAGVMGSATARALARRGVDAILLERFELGHTRGSSHGPTRIFRIAYPDPMYSRMAQRALDLWRELEAEAGEPLLLQTGGLDTGPVGHLVGQALEVVGAPFERLEQEEAAERFPSISFDGLHPIVFQPDAAVCLADRAVAAQIRVASEDGVDVRAGTEVLSVEPGDERVVVRTGAGDIEARAAVVTAGSWAGELLGRLGRTAALSPILQTVTYYPPRDPEAPTVPTFIEWASPELVWYALDAVGEAPGLKVGGHVGGLPIDPNDGPFAADEAQARTQSEYVARRFPGFVPKSVRADTCLYTMTPDEDFVLDRVGPVVIGAGFSGHGFKFGPLVGEILAALALGQAPGMSLERFRLDRPALDATG
jgi:sarcosine oxidase